RPEESTSIDQSPARGPAALPEQARSDTLSTGRGSGRAGCALRSGEPQPHEGRGLRVVLRTVPERFEAMLVAGAEGTVVKLPEEAPMRDFASRHRSLPH